MTRSRPADLSALLSTAVEQALRAPSVHNTQPRQWRITANIVELHPLWTVALSRSGQECSWLRRPARMMVSPSSSSAAPS